jgi:hypothetical protein
MSGKQRFLAGILGALMPICAILLSFDLVNLFGEKSHLTLGNVIGVCIQFFIFMMVGGTVAYMHSDEKKVYKLFQIGMATPALLASFTTSNGLNSAVNAKKEDTTAPIEATDTSVNFFDISLISSAFAYDEKLEAQQLAADPSMFQQIIQGVTGSAYGNAQQQVIQEPAPEGTPPKSSQPNDESTEASEDKKKIKYEQLIKKLDDLENMQQEIRNEVRSLGTNN